MAHTRLVLAIGAPAVATMLLAGCSAEPTDSEDRAISSPSFTPEVTDSAPSSGNFVPAGPPEVRARALGVPEGTIEAIQADVRRWWRDQDRLDRRQVCRQLTANAMFMADWMEQTGLPEGPQQELAAQTLLGLSDTVCWRYKE